MILAPDLISIKHVSRPNCFRPGFYPMLAFLVLGFIFSGLWLTFCIYLVFQGSLEQKIWGGLIALCTICYCAYMGTIGSKLFIDSKRCYELEINSSELVLSVQDKLRHRKSMQMVLLNDIKYVEYYPYPDSAMIYLYAPYTVMEVPLWPFVGEGHDVVDFLAGAGVPILNVLLDDKIPNR